MSDEPRSRGRPRKYAADTARVAERRAEAHRLDAERDRLAAEAECSETMAAKAAWLHAEAQASAAWAAYLRADGQLSQALKFGDLHAKQAAAHAKAVEMLTHDRVEQLHRLVAERTDAVSALDEELGGTA